MRRIYITAAPLDSNFVLKPVPFSPVNFKSKFPEKEVYYPIVPAIYDSLEEGDTAKLIVIHQVNKHGASNIDTFKEELAKVNITDIEIVDLPVEESQDQDILFAAFETLISNLENDATYYADATFGTKTYPLMLFAALRYADRILEGNTVSNIYYQEIKRENGVRVDQALYDVTGIYSIDYLMDSVKDIDPAARQQFIKLLLHPETK